jgi:putative sterol carrier protein
MPDLSNIDDYADIAPAQFAALVKQTSDRELAQILSGPHRKTILDNIFTRMPEQFRPDRAGSTRAVIHWVIAGGADGPDTYEVRVADGKCETSLAPTVEEPDLAITIGPVEFVKVVSGNANPMMMFMTGKIKATNLPLAANIQNLFAVPKA